MTDHSDEHWMDWARARWLEVSGAISKFYFERLQSLSNMPAAQRARLMPEATNFEDLSNNDIDAVRFRRALHAWMYENPVSFKEETLASLNCDPDAWKRGDKSKLEK